MSVLGGRWRWLRGVVIEELKIRMRVLDFASSERAA